MSKMDLYAWQRHLLYAKITHPFEQIVESALNRRGMTLPIVVLAGHQPSSQWLLTTEPYTSEADLKGVSNEIDGVETDPPKLLTEDEAKLVTEAKEIDKSMGDIPLQNVTLAEFIADRSGDCLTPALSRLHARYRVYGVPIYKVHTDRERAFLTKPIQRWCELRAVVLIMTAGDDSKANGRIEGELHQVKRRAQVLLSAAQLHPSYWPCAVRHSAELRFRAQALRLGVPCPQTLQFGASAVVRAKRRRKAGQLANPYKPRSCLYMSTGWIARDSRGAIQPSRTATVPSAAV